LARFLLAAVVLAASLVAGVLVWQAFSSSGVPDPTSRNLSPVAALLPVGEALHDPVALDNHQRNQPYQLLSGIVLVRSHAYILVNVI